MDVLCVFGWSTALWVLSFLSFSFRENRERARPSIRPAVWNDAGLVKCPFLSRREAREQRRGGPPPKPRRSPPILQARTATFPDHLCCRALSDELILTRTRLALHLCLPAPITGVCCCLWWICRRYTQRPQSPPGPPEANRWCCRFLAPPLLPGEEERGFRKSRLGLCL